MARRMLQRLTRGSAAEVPQEAGDGAATAPLAGATGVSPSIHNPLSKPSATSHLPVRPASVPPPRNSESGRCPVVSSGDGVAQGKVSWWARRRGRSQGADRSSHDAPTAADAVSRERADEANPVCYFYDAFAAGGAAEGEDHPHLGRFAAALRRNFAPPVVVSSQPTSASSMVLMLGEEDLPPGCPTASSIQGPQGPMTEVAVLGLSMGRGGWLAVAVPASVLLPPDLPESHPMASTIRPGLAAAPMVDVAAAARRRLDSELSMLGAYLAFLDTAGAANQGATAPTHVRRVSNDTVPRCDVRC